VDFQLIETGEETIFDIAYEKGTLAVNYDNNVVVTYLVVNGEFTENKTYRIKNIWKEFGTLRFYKGDIYATVQIGPQCWFAEYIRVTVYPDDSPITKGNPINGQSFGNSTSANYSCPPNDVNGYTNGEDCAAAANELKLGMLYQSRAAQQLLPHCIVWWQI